MDSACAALHENGSALPADAESRGGPLACMATRKSRAPFVTFASRWMTPSKLRIRSKTRILNKRPPKTATTVDSSLSRSTQAKRTAAHPRAERSKIISKRHKFASRRSGLDGRVKLRLPWSTPPHRARPLLLLLDARETDWPPLRRVGSHERPQSTK